MSGMKCLTVFNLCNCCQLIGMAPFCDICSYRQTGDDRPRPIFHLHSSAREVRIMQGVEYSTKNRNYFCTTCMTTHPTYLDYGLNVCLSDSQLHNFHHPRDPLVDCPPDSLHVDWLTISGGTIADLRHGYLVDYRKQPRAQRILVSAGFNDLMRGASRDTVVERFIHLKETIDAQNAHHPNSKNELVIATILNPPKLVWFSGNGDAPPNFQNRLQELKDLNSWIKFYNSQNGRICTPAFHRFGIRTIKGVLAHHFSQWRQSEPVADMVHLNDRMRVRMGQAVLRHFSGEIDRFGYLD